jgi:hypothetical protein
VAFNRETHPESFFENCLYTITSAQLELEVAEARLPREGGLGFSRIITYAQLLGTFRGNRWKVKQ